MRSCEHFRGRPAQKQFSLLCQNSKVWVILTCKSTYCTAAEMEAEGCGWVGGWVVLPGTDGAPSLVHSVGVFVGWNGSHLHWGVWASLTVGLSGAISRVGAMRSAAAVGSITERSVCVSMCPSSSMPGPRRQPERPCDATHSWLQSTAGLALEPTERVGWAGGGWLRTRLSRGWRGGY